MIPLVSTRGRGLKRSSWRLIAIKLTRMWNWSLRTAAAQRSRFTGKSDAFRIPLKQRRWLGLQMLEGDIYSAPTPVKRRSIWMPPSPVCVRDGRSGAAHCRCALPVHCCHCDVVSNTLTAEPSRFTTAVEKSCSTVSSVCRFSSL